MAAGADLVAGGGQNRGSDRLRCEVLGPHFDLELGPLHHLVGDHRRRSAAAEHAEPAVPAALVAAAPLLLHALHLHVRRLTLLLLEQVHIRFELGGMPPPDPLPHAPLLVEGTVREVRLGEILHPPPAAPLGTQVPHPGRESPGHLASPR